MSSTDKVEDLFVTVIAPVQNDKPLMKGFIDATAEILKCNYANYEVVLVEAGANDDVLDTVVAQLNDHACLRLIRLSQENNRDTAIFAGLDMAIGDVVVVLLPSTDKPELIPQLVSLVRSGNDIIYGLSEVPTRRPALHDLGSRLFYWYSRRYLNMTIPRNSTYLIALNRRSVNALTKIRGRYRHVRQLSRQVGFKSANFIYKPTSSHLEGRSLIKSVALAIEISTSYSRQPLKLVSRLGLLAGSINLAYVLYVIGVYFFRRKVAEGWVTLSLEMAFMFMFLFILLSVVAEYVGRILEETTAQPPYHIMEELDSTVLVADETRRNVTKS